MYEAFQLQLHSVIKNCWAIYKNQRRLLTIYKFRCKWEEKWDSGA